MVRPKVTDFSDFRADVMRLGRMAGQKFDGAELQKWILGGRTVEQRMGNVTFQISSDFGCGLSLGNAECNESHNFRSWRSGEAGAAGGGEDEMKRGTSGGSKENRVQFVVASRSLQASSYGGRHLGLFARRIARNGTAVAEEEEGDAKGHVDSVSVHELLRHPIAIVSLVPSQMALFVAGSVAGAAAKTLTAPLDRVKLLLQVHGVQAAQAGIKSSLGFMDATMKVVTEEGVKGLWKGNLPQVIRVIPHSAVQLLAYETYKRVLKGKNAELPVGRRLMAGACAGMTSTLVTYPLDTLRLRMAVDPASKTMGQMIGNMMKQEGLGAFYRGLGPALVAIAPYIALNFCIFDLVKTSLPKEVRTRPEASLVTALVSATFATAVCYPLDTVRRQLQMKGTPFNSVVDAIPSIVARDGFSGLYRGFLPNALKNLPNSSIRLTTFDAAKNLISASQAEYSRLLHEMRKAGDSGVHQI